nr:MAG TPA: foot protein [Bacteriophage sp.]
MKKLLTALAVSGLFLAACAEESKPAEPEAEKAETVEEAPAEESKEEEEPAEETNEGVTEYNEEVLNDDTVQITLESIEVVEDEFMGTSYEVKFNVENKSDKKIIIQSDDISIDDQMVDPVMYSMSTDVMPGKKATAKLSMHAYEDGEELPELKGAFEFTLYVIDGETYEHISEPHTSIELK